MKNKKYVVYHPASGISISNCVLAGWKHTVIWDKGVIYGITMPESLKDKK